MTYNVLVGRYALLNQSVNQSLAALKDFGGIICYMLLENTRESLETGALPYTHWEAAYSIS